MDANEAEAVLDQAMQEPASGSNDMGSFSNQSPADLMKWADRKKAEQAAKAKNRSFGVQFRQLKLPGGNGT